MWYDCTKTALKKLKVAYNNSLRRFMGLPWHNSASEMFVNLNIKSFGEMLRCFVSMFCFSTMLRCFVSMFCFPCRIFASPLQIFCNYCSFCFIVLTCFIFIYVCSTRFFIWI